MNRLNKYQHAQLLRGVNPSRVRSLSGNSHMEAYDIRAHLNRVFGFANWSAEVVTMELIFERFHKNSKGKDAVSVGYRAGLALTVCGPDGSSLATYTEYAAGSASGFPVSKQADAHDMSMKTAESQALKRAAINLGDQFGLSLYQKNSVKPIVMQTLDVHEVDEDVAKDVPKVVAEAEPHSVSADESVGAWKPSEDFLALMRDRTTEEEKKAVFDAAKEDGADQPYLDELRRVGSA